MSSNSLSAARTSPAPSVCVVGLGYIGLPTAAILARSGCQVRGVDVRPDVVETINRGEIHIHEPHLDSLVADVVAAGRLRASAEPAPADVFMLCVPTPVNQQRAPDLSYVEAASRAVAPHVRSGSLVILESTSPPGTTDQVVAAHAVPPGWKVGRDVFVAHCPERVLPGRILIEAVENDRIVGGVTPMCTQRAMQFFQRYVTGEVVPASAVAAEMAKLVENSFRDVNIAFANELSMLAAEFSVDSHQIIELANRHPRVNILTPGPGVGGHCISVDPWFLHHAAPERTPLIRTAREVNNAKPLFVVEQVAAAAAQRPEAVIGCLGLAYKADVDDLRESPSLEIVRALHQRGIGRRRLVCEPLVSPASFDEFPLSSLDTVLDKSDILVLLTDHREFRELPASALAGKLLVDPRGSWRAAAPKSGSLRRAA